MGRCAVRLGRAVRLELGRFAVLVVLVLELLGTVAGLVEWCAGGGSCGRLGAVAVWLVAPMDGSEGPELLRLVERLARSAHLVGVPVR